MLGKENRFQVSNKAWEEGEQIQVSNNALEEEQVSGL